MFVFKIVLKAYVLAPRGTPCTWKNCHALPRCSHWKRMKQSLSFSLKGRNGESIGAKLQALMCGLTKSDCKESWSTKKALLKLKEIDLCFAMSKLIAKEAKTKTDNEAALILKSNTVTKQSITVLDLSFFKCKLL